MIVKLRRMNSHRGTVRRTGAALLLLFGTLSLGYSLLGFWRVHQLSAPAGDSAGAAATPEQLCARSVPADAAQACLALFQRQVQAIREPALLAFAVGAVGTLTALGLLGRSLPPRVSKRPVKTGAAT